MCQGPDKILTFGADVCADSDNFDVSLLGPTYPPKNSFYYDFSGLFGMSVRNADNFNYLRSVSQSGQYRAAENFLRPDNSRLG